MIMLDVLYTVGYNVYRDRLFIFSLIRCAISDSYILDLETGEIETTETKEKAK